MEMKHHQNNVTHGQAQTYSKLFCLIGIINRLELNKIATHTAPRPDNSWT